MAGKKKSDEEYKVDSKSVLDVFFTSSKEKNQKTQTLAISSIEPNPEQPRKYFDKETLNQLVSSVEETGILQPIIVRPLDGGKYQIVAGERRFSAASKAGLREVPVVIRELTDEQVQEIALIENITRDELNPVEETQAIVKLIANHIDYSHQDTVELIRKGYHKNRKSALKIQETEEWKYVVLVLQKMGYTPISFSTNRLPLLKLPEDILSAIQKGELAYSKGKIIGTIKDKQKRKNLLKQAIKNNLSREEIKVKVAQIRKKSKIQTPQNQNVLIELDTVYKEAKKYIKVEEDNDKIEKIKELIEKLKEELNS